MAAFVMRVGMTLPNGAILLAFSRRSETDPWTVLADQGRGHAQPYVTWKVGDDGECYWGRYYYKLSEAVVDYEERAGL